MGGLMSTPGSSRHGRFDDTADKPWKSLDQREQELFLSFMTDYQRLLQEVSTNDIDRSKLLEPEDNSEYAHIEFVRSPLPRDDDGFVVAFDSADTVNISSFFDRYGLVVVRGVLDAPTCERSRDEVWSLLEREVPGLSRNDARTWDRWTSLAWGGFAGNTFNLSNQLCENRQSEAVHNSFASVFGRRDLHVNVGRVGIMRPTRGVPAGEAGEDGQPSIVDKPEWRTLQSNKWLHWDCNPWTGATSSFSWSLSSPVANRRYMYNSLAVQAVIALSESGENDGGFYAVPSSHKIIHSWAHAHPEFHTKMVSPEGPMQFQLPPEETYLREAAEKVPIREGDLLIWNAATLHCNYPNDSSRPRMVQFIQMKPADDLVLKPLLQDLSLLPAPDHFRSTALGRRLYGFDDWTDS